MIIYYKEKSAAHVCTFIYKILKNVNNIKFK